MDYLYTNDDPTTERVLAEYFKDIIEKEFPWLEAIWYMYSFHTEIFVYSKGSNFKPGERQQHTLLVINDNKTVICSHYSKSSQIVGQELTKSLADPHVFSTLLEAIAKHHT